MITLPWIAELIILCAMVASAVMAIRAKDLLISVLCLAFVSLLVSLEMYILQAPDVAIAEAGIGVVLTTAIFIFAIRTTERKEAEE